MAANRTEPTLFGRRSRSDEARAGAGTARTVGTSRGGGGVSPPHPVAATATASTAALRTLTTEHMEATKECPFAFSVALVNLVTEIRPRDITGRRRSRPC